MGLKQTVCQLFQLYTGARVVDEMSLNILTAAHYLCDKSGWTLSNLKLQKLFYFAQMVAWGEFNEKIVRDDFQAWALGPVNADLYHEVKIYGSAPVGSLHTGNDAPSGIRRHLLDQTLRSMGAMSVGELILISHWTKGAWAKHYVSGKKNRVIPKSDMAEEYRMRRELLSEPENA